MSLRKFLDDFLTRIAALRSRMAETATADPILNVENEIVASCGSYEIQPQTVPPPIFHG
jgi:hypothetical protein